MESALKWLIGGAVGAGVLYFATRPAKAAAAPAVSSPAPPIPPPTPQPPQAYPTCTPTLAALDAWGKAANIQIWISYPSGAGGTAGSTDLNAPALIWTEGESVLRTKTGDVDQLGTAMLCVYMQSGGTVHGVGVGAADPGCFPPGAVQWHMQSEASAPLVGYFYKQVYQYDLGSNAWYLFRSKGPFTDLWALHVSGWPEVPDVLERNPPWRYALEWYWSDKGWRKFRESDSWSDESGNWQYSFYTCGGALEANPVEMFLPS